MKLIVIYVESSFHVIPYLAWEWFEYLIFFYLTFLRLSSYLYFANNLKDTNDHMVIIEKYGFVTDGIQGVLF